MLYAYIDGSSPHLLSHSTEDSHDFLCDKDCEQLFQFAEADVSSFTELFIKYFDSRIDHSTLECRENDEMESSLFHQMYTALSDLHPFFCFDDHASTLPYLLANTLNQLVEDKDLSQEQYLKLLKHLTDFSLNFCLTHTGVASTYYDSFVFQRHFYEEYTKRNDPSIRKKWRRDGIGGMESLHKYVRSYLYCILDSSAKRFCGLTTEQRLRLFSSVYGSVNTWQPLVLREAICVGTLDSHTVEDIFRKGQIRILNAVSAADFGTASETIIAETKTAATNELKRAVNSKALESLDSDDALLSDELSEWLDQKISEAKSSDTSPWLRAYEISSFSEYILLQLSLLTENEVIIKRCKNCGRYFLPDRSNVDYCQRVLPGENLTCFEIGPKRVFNRLLAADQPRNLYSKAYKKYQARLRRKTITEDEFHTWREQAKEYLNKVQNDQISLEEYESWMEK